MDANFVRINPRCILKQIRFKTKLIIIIILVVGLMAISIGIEVANCVANCVVKVGLKSHFRDCIVREQSRSQ